MDDRFNTIAGWALAAGIVALGSSIVAGEFFHAERPEVMGYPIAGVVEEDEGAAAEEPIEVFLAKADPAKGATVFNKCTACHTINAGGANGLGPNLHGVMGEEIGHGRGGFAFSPALSGKGGKWDWQSMNAWLTSPRTFAPGTKMTFAGLSNPQERADLMAYLNSQGSNLPLPAVPATAAPAANEAAPAEGNSAAPAEGNGAAPPEANAAVATGQ